MSSTFLRLMKDRAGVTAIEYGVIALLIAVGIVVSASTVGSDLGQTFTTIASEFGGGGGGGGGIQPGGQGIFQGGRGGPPVQ